MTIGAKIGAGFGVVVLMFAVVGVVSFANVNHLSATADEVDHTHRSLEEIDHVFESVLEIEAGMYNYVLTGDEHALEQYEHGEATLWERFEAGRASNLTEPGQLALWDKLEPELHQLTMQTDHIVELRRTEGFEAANAVVGTGEAKLLMEEIEGDLAHLATEEGMLLDTRAREAADSVSSTKAWVLGGVLLAGLVGAAIAIYLARAIARPLRRTAERARMIAAGSLDVEPLALTSNDEIGLLGSSFDEMSTMLATVGTQAQLIADGNINSPLLDTDLPGQLGASFSTMVGSLKNMVSRVTGSSHQLAATAQELTTVSSSMTVSAERTSIEATSASASGEQVSANHRNVRDWTICCRSSNRGQGHCSIGHRCCSCCRRNTAINRRN
ncbi:MAG: methyl-accepting chemotaxis protein [Actinomycetia bacterium]|nr:methyl-accepting chemotaxis protein [Actinomycetes bacterium]